MGLLSNDKVRYKFCNSKPGEVRTLFLMLKYIINFGNWKTPKRVLRQTGKTQMKSHSRRNHKLQTTPWHLEEEPLNHHETPGRQTKQSNQLSLPHQDD